MSQIPLERQFYNLLWKGKQREILVEKTTGSEMKQCKKAELRVQCRDLGRTRISLCSFCKAANEENSLISVCGTKNNQKETQKMMEQHLLLTEAGNWCTHSGQEVKVKRDISAQRTQIQAQSVRKDEYRSPPLHCCIPEVGQGVFLCYC